MLKDQQFRASKTNIDQRGLRIWIYSTLVRTVKAYIGLTPPSYSISVVNLFISLFWRGLILTQSTYSVLLCKVRCRMDWSRLEGGCGQRGASGIILWCHHDIIKNAAFLTVKMMWIDEYAYLSITSLHHLRNNSRYVSQYVGRVPITVDWSHQTDRSIRSIVQLLCTKCLASLHCERLKRMRAALKSYFRLKVSHLAPIF